MFLLGRYLVAYLVAADHLDGGILTSMILALGVAFLFGPDRAGGVDMLLGQK